MNRETAAVAEFRCPHCGGIVRTDPVLCPYCHRPLRTGFENQRKGESLNEGLVWQNRHLKRSLDASLAREAELKKRYTIEGLQPWAEPPTSCPRCGSGTKHDVEGFLRDGHTFEQDGATKTACLNEACGWTAIYPKPHSLASEP